MTRETSILFVKQDTAISQTMLARLDEAGFALNPGSYADLAANLTRRPNYEIIVFDASCITDEARMQSVLELAREIKTNPKTQAARLLCIGISHTLLRENQPHHFDDLQFGAVHTPALIARLHSQRRLAVIEAEVKRRNQLNALYDNQQTISPPEIEKDATILITGRPNGYEKLESTLAPHATLVGAMSLDTANDYLKRQHFDMIIINSGNQPARYFAFVETIRANPVHAALPILLVTRQANLSGSHIAFQAGLTDIIDAPINTNELLLRTACLVREQRTRRAIARTYREARHIPTNDALTGLYNFGYFASHLTELVNDHKTTGCAFSLITLKLENLNTINASVGPQQGDRILRQISDILMGIIRSEDLASRISGRTFVLTLPATDEREAANVLARIEALLKQTTFIMDHENDSLNVEFQAELITSNGTQPADELLSACQRPAEASGTIIAA